LFRQIGLQGLLNGRHIGRICMYMDMKCCCRKEKKHLRISFFQAHTTHTHIRLPVHKASCTERAGEEPKRRSNRQTNKQTTRKKPFYFVLCTPPLFFTGLRVQSPPFLPPFSFPPNSALTKIPTIYRRITRTVTTAQKPPSSFPKKRKKKKK
jgi:hypothetical protein